MGGAEALADAFEIMLPRKDITNLPPMKFFQCVAHTASLNLAQNFGIRGFVMATSAACASGLQAVGTAADLIRLGRQDIVLCGGAEELHPTVTASFDALFATSTKFNSEPTRTPRPFDRDRDGLVCGEGAAILVLEDYDHAKRRNAPIRAELTGYNSSASGLHVSQSSGDSILASMRGAMAEADVWPADIDYISAHATATVQGDQEEAAAIRGLFGDRVPVSSLKGYFGHTLGASGALELVLGLVMMETDTIYPTRNLENVAPDCDGILHVHESMDRHVGVLLKNCFAFGGISASIVCRKI
jgi:3-oxoacyl-[acyl-carrier-protein] synthase II